MWCRSTVRPVLVTLVATAGCACAALAGLDSFTQGEPDGASASDDVTVQGGGDSGTGGDSTSGEGDTTDAGPTTSGDSGGVQPLESGAEVDGATGSCTCVGAAPAGWQGYVQLALGDAGASSCISPYGTAQNQLKASPTGPNAQCSACTCALPGPPITCQVKLGSGGLLCVNETMTIAAQNLCALPPGPMGATSGPNGDSYGPTMFPAPVGNCAPDGGIAQIQAPQSTSVTVCAAADAGSGASCPSSGQVCVPSPSMGSAASLTGACIYRSGAQTCPAGAYSVNYLASSSISDDRGCSACACAAPACPADGYVEGFASLDCSGAVATTFGASTSCMLGDNANNSRSFLYHPSHGAWNGTCAASGGTPTGAVTLDTSASTTFCCMP